ncbi:response regulator transcription factor [Gracilibacillus massiliensis]|uniref:response regulator transcription factor n=1 Tax=Gracilibacillus massiliensis TaxID=1564956 RepID=UPI00071D3A64|nr:response regulator transcription factor [Gracilibacillus massiliensis]
MNSQKILVVEDEFGVREMTRMYLEKQEYTVFTTDSGTEVLNIMNKHHPDAILLDIEMPKLDGFEVCQQIRKHFETPIIFMSVRRETADKVKSLELGGDDYLTKPFEFIELEARIKAVLRRVSSEQASVNNKLIYGTLVIDLDRFSCYLNQEELILSRKEMELLILLARHPKRVWSTEHLYDQLWGIDSTGNSETVKVHISTLRKKIEVNPAKPKFIKTIRGFGYCFEQGE